MPIQSAPDYVSSVDSTIQGKYNQDELEFGRGSEKQTAIDFEKQKGTPIPALYNQFYKFIANPSTVSIDTFKRMIDTDDTLGAGVDFLQICLAARIGAYQHKSQEVTDFINNMLNKLKGGFFNNVKAMLDAAWAGFSVQEMIWENAEEGFVVRKLVPLPPSTLLFEVEPTGELTPDGILQYQRGYNPSGFGYGGASIFGFSNAYGQPDPWAKFGDMPYPVRTGNAYSYMSARIPAQKCMHFAFNSPGLYGNPYGRSLLRRAYKWWIAKDAYIRMLAVALDRKGTPLTVVFADPHQTVGDPNKIPTGQNAKGDPSKGMRANEAVAKAFANVHNDSVITLPGRKGQVYDIQQLAQGSNAEEFISAIKECNAGGLRALLVPDLIFSNGDGQGSFALGQEHARTWEKILDGMNEGVKQTWIHQCIAQAIMYNFPENVWKKDGFGAFTKRELTQDERDKEMTIIATACDKGFVDQSDMEDLNIVREKIGFPPRTKPIEAPDMGLEEGEDKEGSGDDEE